MGKFLLYMSSSCINNRYHKFHKAEISFQYLLHTVRLSACLYVCRTFTIFVCLSICLPRSFLICLCSHWQFVLVSFTYISFIHRISSASFVQDWTETGRIMKKYIPAQCSSNWMNIIENLQSHPLKSSPGSHPK